MVLRRSNLVVDTAVNGANGVDQKARSPEIHFLQLDRLLQMKLNFEFRNIYVFGQNDTSN